jgi:hypothetical protein
MPTVMMVRPAALTPTLVRSPYNLSDMPLDHAIETICVKDP